MENYTSSLSGERITEIFRQNETEANRFASNFLMLCAVTSTMIITLLWSDVYTTDIVFATWVFGTETVLRIVIYCICYGFHFRGRWQRYLLLFTLLAGDMCLVVLNVTTLSVYFIIPILLSCRYYDERFTRMIGMVAFALLLIAMPLSSWFDMRYASINANLVNLPEGLTLTIRNGISRTILDSGFFELGDYIANDAGLYAMRAMAIFMAMYIAVIVADHGREMILKQIETAQAKAQAEIDLVNSNTRVMISQIQPHFLYNSLTAIMSVEGNPPETKRAIADFSRYLRGNLDALKSNDCIPFEKELEHIGYYTELELLRFGDRLHIEMDIEADEFVIPALSVQMLLENAVKHGITARSQGGTVWVSSRELEDRFVVEVRDDGVGFNVEQAVPADGRNHVGLASVRERLQVMCGGCLDISTSPGYGTTATITIPKGGRTDANFSG